MNGAKGMTLRPFESSPLVLARCIASRGRESVYCSGVDLYLGPMLPLTGKTVVRNYFSVDNDSVVK
jgi:hypothetical protein